MYSDLETNGRTHTVQVDLVNALSKNTTLNTGLKYIYRHNNSDSKYYNFKGDEQVLNADNSVKYNNDPVYSCWIHRICCNDGKIQYESRIAI